MEIGNTPWVPNEETIALFVSLTSNVILTSLGTQGYYLFTFMKTCLTMLGEFS